MVLCLVLDAIDHSKFKYPRNRNFSSKELSTYNRPSLDVMGMLVHGYIAMLALSEPFVKKGSSFCADYLLHSLMRVGRQGLDLRGASLHIQSDNTSKETKNNTVLRLGSLLTALHRVKRCDIQNLLSGHSHEDIDQWFSVITALLEVNPTIGTPKEFVRVLNQYLRDASSRPYEVEREAFLVESTRDWSLDCIYPHNPKKPLLEFVFSSLFHLSLRAARKTHLQLGFGGAHLQGVGGPGAPHVPHCSRLTFQLRIHSCMSGPQLGSLHYGSPACRTTAHLVARCTVSSLLSCRF